MTPIHNSTGANWSFSDRFNIPPCHNDTSTSSSAIDINHIAVSHSHDRIIQNQNQSLSVPLPQQSVNGTQKSLLGSLAQQSLIDLVCTLDQGTNDIDNSSEVSES